MQVSLYILYGIALVLIVLGFIALLKQKTYIDKDTRQVTEVALPFLGKMKTNYPSLLFLATGVSLAFFVFNKSYDKTTEWTIKGQFVDPTRSVTNFNSGELKVIPGNIQSRIGTNGNFEITMKIRDGLDFEDAVESIVYSYNNYSASILPFSEKEKKKLNDNTCLLNNSTRTTRTYKAVPINSY